LVKLLTGRGCKVELADQFQNQYRSVWSPRAPTLRRSPSIAPGPPDPIKPPPQLAKISVAIFGAASSSELMTTGSESCRIFLDADCRIHLGAEERRGLRKPSGKGRQALQKRDGSAPIPGRRKGYT
jgi:hypothetical protein